MKIVQLILLCLAEEASCPDYDTQSQRFLKRKSFPFLAESFS